MIILSGGSCAGKTTLARALSNIGWTWVRSVTTRPPRPYSADEYSAYLSNREFLDLQDEGKIVFPQAYQTEEGIWRYGVPVGSFNRYRRDPYAVCILDPICAAQYFYSASHMLDQGMVFWYLRVPEVTRAKRLSLRGDSEERIRARLTADSRDLQALENGAYDFAVNVVNYLPDGDIVVDTERPCGHLQRLTMPRKENK